MDSPSSSNASGWSTDSDRIFRTVYHSYSLLLRRDAHPISCPDCQEVMYPRNYPNHKRFAHDSSHDPLTECSFCGDYSWKRGRKMHHGNHLRDCLQIFLRDRAARDPDEERSVAGDDDDAAPLPDDERSVAGDDDAAPPPDYEPSVAGDDDAAPDDEAAPVDRECLPPDTRYAADCSMLLGNVLLSLTHRIGRLEERCGQLERYFTAMDVTLRMTAETARDTRNDCLERIRRLEDGASDEASWRAKRPRLLDSDDEDDTLVIDV